MDESNLSTEAGAIIENVKALHGHRAVPLDSLRMKPEIALVPSGMELRSLKTFLNEYDTRPEHLKQTVACGAVDALIGYVNRFKTESSMVFFDANEVQAMVAALDWHDAAVQPLLRLTDAAAAASETDRATPAARPPLASFVTHLATYQFPLSDELRAWLGAAKAPLDSKDFAEFLLDRCNDIEPPPADWVTVDPESLAEVLEAMNLHDDKAPMDASGRYLPPPVSAGCAAPENDEELEETYLPRVALEKLQTVKFANPLSIVAMARTIRITTTSDAQSAYDPATGSQAVVFTEDNTLRGKTNRKIKVPDALLLYIPVFRGEPRRLVPVRLKFRPFGTSIVWGLEIYDARRMIERAITAAAERVAEETGVPVLRGLPIGDSIVAAINAEVRQIKAIAAASK